jgi:hypothetical protein
MCSQNDSYQDIYTTVHYEDSFWKYLKNFRSIVKEIEDDEYKIAYDKGYKDGYENNEYNEGDVDSVGYDEGFIEGKGDKYNEERLDLGNCGEYFIKDKLNKYSDKMLKDKYTQDWVIQKETIDTYFNESISRDEFRVKIYTDSDFINWCKEYSKENNIKLRKNKYSKGHSVLAPGDSWWNWKVGNKSDTGCGDPEKHKFLNPSFHYIKQIYDSEAQPNGKCKKFHLFM